MNYILKNLFIYFLSIFIVLSLPILAGSVLEIAENDFVIGDKNASITIIEYASLSCSHCADFHINTLPELKKEFLTLMQEMR